MDNTMNTEKKISYTTALTNAIEGRLDAETVSRLTDLRIQIAKKSNTHKDNSAKIEADAAYTSLIAENMAKGVDYTVMDIKAAMPTIAALSDNKVSRLMGALVESGTVVKSNKQRKNHYTIAV